MSTAMMHETAQAMRDHIRIISHLADQLDGGDLDEATIVAWAVSATRTADLLRALIRPQELKAAS